MKRIKQILVLLFIFSGLLAKAQIIGGTSTRNSNIFYDGDNEQKYLPDMLIFFANNKSFNWHYRCYEPSLTYKVLQRDAKGIFTKVEGIYKQMNLSGTVFNDYTKIIVYFNQGMPYRVGYPSDSSLPDTYANAGGDMGRLSFSDTEAQRIKQLNDIFDQTQSVEFIKMERESLANLIAWQKQKFGNSACPSCFEFVQIPKTYSYEVVKEDLRGLQYTETKTSGYTEERFKNNCNYPITIIGIEKIADSRQGYRYVDASVTLDAYENSIISQGELYLNKNLTLPDIDFQANQIYYIYVVRKQASSIKVKGKK